MRRTVVLALAALSLSACGPDDRPVNENSSAKADTSVAQPAQGAASFPASAVEPLISAQANDQPASSPAVAAEQSLAADAQQVTPVLHYPPDSTN